MKVFSATPRRAFTLVELLAVIGIIAIMATVIGVSLGGGSNTASLGTSQRIGASIFQSARSNAVLKQTETKVLIYGDNGGETDPGKYLRFLQVIYKNDDGDWVAANTGTYLPQGVYYIPNGGVPGADSVLTVESDDAGALFNDPVKPNENSDADIGFTAYAYSFDSNGLSSDPGDQVVFASGRVAGPPVNGIPDLAFENQYAVLGFFLRRTGSVSLADYDYLD